MHILKFNESNHNFDLNFAISKIKEEFPEERVKEMFDKEWPNWVEEEFSDDLSWYLENSNEEAEEIVYETIIDWFREEFSDKMWSTPSSEQEEELLMGSLKKIYKL